MIYCLSSEMQIPKLELAEKGILLCYENLVFTIAVESRKPVEPYWQKASGFNKNLCPVDSKAIFLLKVVNYCSMVNPEISCKGVHTLGSLRITEKVLN